MPNYTGPESICAKLKDPRPETPGRILDEYKGNGAATHGYTRLARRVRDAIPGEWVDNGEADTLENHDDTLSGLGQVAYSDY